MKWAAASGGSGGASAFFTAYSGSFATATSVSELTNPAMTIPPTQTINLSSETVYFVRFTAATAATPNYLGFFCGTLGSGGAASTEAAIYSSTGTRLATGSATIGDLLVQDIGYIPLSTTTTLTVGTDYYYAIRFVYTSGTQQVYGVGAPSAVSSCFANLFTTSGSYLLSGAKVATMDASLALNSGVATTNGFPWIAGANL